MAVEEATARCVGWLANYRNVYWLLRPVLAADLLFEK
jgi:hypothetical protein